MRKAVFLDRDGVLNEVRFDGTTAASPRTLEEFVVIGGVTEAVDRLRQSAFEVAVITNQPDVGRNLMSSEVLAEMNDVLREITGIDRVEVCIHSGSEECECRKPKPGMILRIAHDLEIDLARSWTVGDRWVDIAAGRDAGTKTILIEHPYSFSSTSTSAPPADLRPDFVAADLTAATQIILDAEAERSFD